MAWQSRGAPSCSQKRRSHRRVSTLGAGAGHLTRLALQLPNRRSHFRQQFRRDWQGTGLRHHSTRAWAPNLHGTELKPLQSLQGFIPAKYNAALAFLEAISDSSHAWRLFDANQGKDINSATDVWQLALLYRSDRLLDPRLDKLRPLWDQFVNTRLVPGTNQTWRALASSLTVRL
jgi:hypothetical protein